MEDTQPPRVGLDPPDWLLHSAQTKEGLIPKVRHRPKSKLANHDLRSPTLRGAELPAGLKFRFH